MLQKLVSNAGANVASGAATAVYQLGLTTLAAHAWHGPEFAAWALALSLANIAPLFGGNLSSVVTRRIIHARHGNEPSRVFAIARAAVRLARHLAALACSLLLMSGLWVAANSDAVFMNRPAFATMLALLVVAHVWVVLWQPRFGQAFANEDNWAAARTLFVSRSCALSAAGGGMLVGVDDPVAVAACLAGGAWFGLGLDRWIAIRKQALHREHPVPMEHVRDEYRENLRTFSGFAVWSLGALVIQYGVPPLVAIIDPGVFNAFYLASTLNLIAIGALTAAMSALLAPLSRWHALDEDGPRMRVVWQGPAICGALSLFTMAILWFGVDPLLALSRSPAVSADQVRDVLALLGVQTLLRTTAMGYSLGLASAGSTAQMSKSIVVEIVLSLTIALPLGYLFGLHSLILGLITAAFVATLYTCQVALPLLAKAPYPRVPASICLIVAQALILGLWWLLARRHFG